MHPQCFPWRGELWSLLPPSGFDSKVRMLGYRWKLLDAGSDFPVDFMGGGVVPRQRVTNLLVFIYHSGWSQVVL